MVQPSFLIPKHSYHTRKTPCPHQQSPPPHPSAPALEHPEPTLSVCGLTCSGRFPSVESHPVYRRVNAFLTERHVLRVRPHGSVSGLLCVAESCSVCGGTTVVYSSAIEGHELLWACHWGIREQASVGVHILALLGVSPAVECAVQGPCWPALRSSCPPAVRVVFS